MKSSRGVGGEGGGEGGNRGGTESGDRWDGDGDP